MEQKQLPKPTIVDLLWLLIPAFWLSVVIFSVSDFSENLSYSDFVSYTNQGKIADIVISKTQIRGVLNDGKPKHFKCVPVDDQGLIKRLEDKRVKFQGQFEDRFWQNSLLWIFAFAALGFVLSGRAPAASSGVMSIARTGARVNVEDNIKTTFDDVAGVDEAKEELQEVIGFLKEPQRYNRLGGHLPKGVLLVGAPGTGKTLLARAVAGEAGVPFFSISGSEFVELFVGVGAARVRSLFEQAQKSAPCIIFIDELDAVGRARSLSGNGSHDEKEQTLNQLLVEMDGFDARQGVVLLAATNRPEILDPALLRAGRFDRHVVVDRPDKPGRLAILKVHLKNILYDDSIDIPEIAAMTPGFTGADLANLVNEAVLLATRRNASKVQTADVTAALERVVAGQEKKNRLLSPTERRVVAYHEMGHALVSMSIAGMDPIQKISIIPRGVGALGYTLQRPTEDRFLMSQSELENKLAVLMGGRAAEAIVFNEVSTGASDDFTKATDIARSMVTRYGMVKTLGPVAYETEPSHFLATALVENRRCSEETTREIEFAIRDLINRSLERATAILLARRAALESGAKLLLERETLTQDELSMVALQANLCQESSPLEIVRK